ncbi:hypothetical protein KP509_09G032200 [Ceratopteris richardii]|uniref:Uncharacterized protein n=1 Tax=Ceratopteris richardii TaxID=49495 RepID=A0A8T2U5E3_CERRI|nr:hypothetical protein KP509_09G032200 [Ceratopteris richardii]
MRRIEGGYRWGRRGRSRVGRAMEPSEIVNVLARANELQNKIDDAIQRASFPGTAVSRRPSLQQGSYDDDNEDDEDDTGTQVNAKLAGFPDLQKLEAIRGALLDLQDQLESLQALHKRHKYEREDLLIELEDRRKVLIEKLKDYNGTEWELVQEANAFVGEPVQKEDDLVLPPYQSNLRNGTSQVGKGSSISLPKLQHNSSRRNSLGRRPGEDEGSDPKNRPRASESPELDDNKSTSSRTPFPGLMIGIYRLASKAGEIVTISAKNTIVIAGIIFTLSQLKPLSKNWSAGKVASSKRYNRIKHSSPKPDGLIIQDRSCPPGKVLLVRDGVQKCFVKERIEAPFEKVVKQPDASYGYG